MLLIDLHRQLFLQMLVHAKSDASVGSLADNFTNLIILEEAPRDRFYFPDIIRSLACVDNLVAAADAKESVPFG